jgi:hypothetical protein
MSPQALYFHLLNFCSNSLLLAGRTEKKAEVSMREEGEAVTRTSLPATGGA